MNMKKISEKKDHTVVEAQEQFMWKETLHSNK